MSLWRIIWKSFQQMICIGILLCSSAQASTDLATAPVSFLASALVKPNIYFIIDDSGSMIWSYIGDEVVIRGYEKAIGYRSYRCNKLYYNPAVTYSIPVNSDGSLFASQSFTSARYDGFNNDSMTIDLSKNFMAWRTSKTSPPVPANTNTVEYRIDCSSAAGECAFPGSADYPNAPEAAYYYIFIGTDDSHLGDGSAEDPCFDRASSNWKKVIVSSESGPGNYDERTNFANWFSYHRTRILTLKTALGRAFRDFDEHFRVGFSTIGESGVADSTGFLKIDDFTSAQKTTFYRKLYAINPVASTPLRAALSKAGRLYAGKLLTGADDPVQYSCQQNFTVLSTDGYWNTSWEYGSYGPKQIDGQTNVGDQDANLPAPMNDGRLGTSDIYAAKITLIPDMAHASNYMAINRIVVDGVDIMTNTVSINSTSDRNVSVSTIAFSAEARARLGGYRVIAQGPVIYVIPPPSLRPVNAPVVTVSGAISATVEPFNTITMQSRRANTLADVAAYYFQTDLRQPSLSNCGTDSALCANNVPVLKGVPGGSHQHMVTHTVGLGASGTLRYQEDYESAASGDFRDIADGKRGWPDPIFFNGAERIDDLWHAAVNGGGHYFNASNPQQLARALSETMARIRSVAGAAAAAATSNQEPAEGDSLLFGTRYRSIYWDGDLEARRIDLNDGSASATREWSAEAQLDQRVYAQSDQRALWLQSASDPTQLRRFVWGELDERNRDFFRQMCGTSPKLSQCARLSTDDKARVSGENLLNYLRGQYGYEDRVENASKLFRRRGHVLGAPVNAQPVYVGRPVFRYADDYYGEFRDSTQVNRKGMVYVVANDGMLHAFDAASGAEDWALIPAAVLPNLYRYADIKFSQDFSYLLDGTPVVGDICPIAATTTASTTTVSPRCTAAQWRTILVAGLGAAGREFYALDITDPAHPKALWRFGVEQDNDLGYALGRPLITKRRDGRWIAVFTSGYNNVNPGSGLAYLFVLDAYTGQLLQKIGTGTGSTTEPSGLGQVNGWVENLLDNTSLRFYSGDLLGNVWRFDINDLYPPQGREAVLLAKLVRDGQPQPVTTRPELSEVRIGQFRSTVVSVGTGSYLGLSDARDKSVQSIYSFRDDLQATGYGNAREKLVQQTLSALSDDPDKRTVSAHAVDWSATSEKPGWFIDLTVDSKFTGERVTLDPDQQQGILRVVTNTPDGTPCRAGAESWIYEIDYLTGTYMPNDKQKVIARRVAAGVLTAGARTLKLGEKVVTLLTNERGELSSQKKEIPSSESNTVRRVSWRELDE